ncbi:hypothetical protein BT69DRAFT_1326050 [Atractiella rhizophila]|nr:hypothetical protein BT69DRAFT_1326050 [Atractiella rhizophila]
MSHKFVWSSEYAEKQLESHRIDFKPPSEYSQAISGLRSLDKSRKMRHLQIILPKECDYCQFKKSITKHSTPGLGNVAMALQMVPVCGSIMQEHMQQEMTDFQVHFTRRLNSVRPALRPRLHHIDELTDRMPSYDGLRVYKGYWHDGVPSTNGLKNTLQEITDHSDQLYIEWAFSKSKELHTGYARRNVASEIVQTQCINEEPGWTLFSRITNFSYEGILFETLVPLLSSELIMHTHGAKGTSLVRLQASCSREQAKQKGEKKKTPSK